MDGGIAHTEPNEFCAWHISKWMMAVLLGSTRRIKCCSLGDGTLGEERLWITLDVEREKNAKGFLAGSSAQQEFRHSATPNEVSHQISHGPASAGSRTIPV